MEERERTTIVYLDKVISEFEKSDYENIDKKIINRESDFLNKQINFFNQINLINVITANHYLARVEEKRLNEIKKSREKEYREQVINFNDDITTEKERILLTQKKEAISLNDWEKIINEESKEDKKQISVSNEKEKLNII